MGPNNPAASCVYCSGKLYTLGEGMVKCSHCRRKYSPRKAAKERRIIEAFCAGLPALKTSEELALSYRTVLNAYQKLRALAAAHLEQAYESRRSDVAEFDEYIYLEASKRRDRRHIFDAHNFLTFAYGERIYTLMMPSLHRYKEQFLDDGLESLYYHEFDKFLRLHRIARLEKSKNRITEFWDFFEDFILRYKGVKPENFVYYLKEAEFRFNYGEAERIALLQNLWFR